MSGTLRGNLPTSCTVIFMIGMILVSPLAAVAGEWRVTPIRLFFDKGSRSGILNVQNDGEKPMNLQVKAMEWTQDAEGKDQYAETADLVFFPKFLMVPGKEERVVRIGNKGVPGAKERTYRVFIEEVTPPPKDDQGQGATVFVNVRFAVPLFAGPAKEEVSAKLRAELKKGAVTAVIENTGNLHFRLTALEARGKSAKGEETFRQKVDGWYLLNGAKRSYTFQIPKDGCLASDSIELEGKADRTVTIKAGLAVDKAQCLP